MSALPATGPSDNHSQPQLILHGGLHSAALAVGCTFLIFPIRPDRIRSPKKSTPETRSRTFITIIPPDIFTLHQVGGDWRSGTSSSPRIRLDSVITSLRENRTVSIYQAITHTSLMVTPVSASSMSRTRPVLLRLATAESRDIPEASTDLVLTPMLRPRRAVSTSLTSQVRPIPLKLTTIRHQTIPGISLSQETISTQLQMESAWRFTISMARRRMRGKVPGSPEFNSCTTRCGKPSCFYWMESSKDP